MKVLRSVLYLCIAFHVLFAETEMTSSEIDTLNVQSVHTVFPEQTSGYNFFKCLGFNFVEQSMAPFSMDRDQAILLGGGVIITGVLIAYDHEIDNIFSPLGNKNKFIRHGSPQITELGGAYGIMATAAFGAYSIISNDSKAQQTALLLTEAIVTSGVWVRIGKLIFSRERPSASYEFSRNPGGDWHWASGFFAQRFQTVGQVDAFPSGHTATAFSIAAVIDDAYGETPFISEIAYSLASIVGVTRMIEHTHWASDVFIGGIVGYLCGKEVSRHYLLNHDQKSERVKFFLGVIGSSPALKLSLLL